MRDITIEEVQEYVEKHISEFHQRRLDSLQKMKLREVLLRKNPYLFRSKNILVAGDLIKRLLEAQLSSKDETIFGDFLEALAIHINGIVFGGKKSTSDGIDLDFDREGIRYIVNIKSGPRWANKSQYKQMKTEFEKAMKVARQNNQRLHIIAVNGCCYGRDTKEDKGTHLKLCGQAFWEFISGDNQLYVNIVEPLGFKAKERNDEFEKAFAAVQSQFTVEFVNDFCRDGNIDWGKLVSFNSAINKPKLPNRIKRKASLPLA